MTFDESPSSRIEAGWAAMPEGTTPADALRVVFDVYEQDTAEVVDNPPTAAQRSAVSAWATSSRRVDPFMLPRPTPPVPRFPVVSRSIPELAWRATQFACVIHRGSDAAGLAGAETFPVGINPWSAQARRNRGALRDAVREALLRDGKRRLPWGDQPLCVSITSVVPRREADKDVDNLVKGLLDAMQSYLYRNDKQIHCLTLRKMPFAGKSGHYVVHAQPIAPWTDRVIVDDPATPTILWGLVNSPPRD